VQEESYQLLWGKESLKRIANSLIHKITTKGIRGLHLLRKRMGEG
jgi:hypothetical protein